MDSASSTSAENEPDHDSSVSEMRISVATFERLRSEANRFKKERDAVRQQLKQRELEFGVLKKEHHRDVRKLQDEIDLLQKKANVAALHRGHGIGNKGSSTPPVVQTSKGRMTTPLSALRPATTSAADQGDLEQFSAARAERYMEKAVDAFQRRKEEEDFDPEGFYSSHRDEIATLVSSFSSAEIGWWMNYLFRYAVESATALKDIHDHRSPGNEAGFTDVGWPRKAAKILCNLLHEGNAESVILLATDEIKIQSAKDLVQVLVEFVSKMMEGGSKPNFYVQLLKDLTVAWSSELAMQKPPIDIFKAVEAVLADMFQLQFDLTDEENLHDQDDFMMAVVCHSVQQNLISLDCLLGPYLKHLICESYVLTERGACHIGKLCELVKFARSAIGKASEDKKKQLMVIFHDRMKDLKTLAKKSTDKRVLDAVSDVRQWAKSFRESDETFVVEYTRSSQIAPEEDLDADILEGGHTPPACHLNGSDGDQTVSARNRAEEANKEETLGNSQLNKEPVKRENEQASRDDMDEKQETRSTHGVHGRGQEISESNEVNKKADQRESSVFLEENEAADQKSSIREKLNRTFNEEVKDAGQGDVNKGRGSADKSEEASGKSGSQNLDEGCAHEDTPEEKAGKVVEKRGVIGGAEVGDEEGEEQESMEEEKPGEVIETDGEEERTEDEDGEGDDEEGSEVEDEDGEGEDEEGSEVEDEDGKGEDEEGSEVEDEEGEEDSIDDGRLSGAEDEEGEDFVEDEDEDSMDASYQPGSANGKIDEEGEEEGDSSEEQADDESSAEEDEDDEDSEDEESECENDEVKRASNKPQQKVLRKKSPSPASPASLTPTPVRGGRGRQRRRLARLNPCSDESSDEQENASQNRTTVSVASQDSSAGTCLGKTKTGNPCKLKCQLGSRYCHVHRPKK